MPASDLSPPVLTKRRDFLAAAKRGHKGKAAAIVVQLLERGDDGVARYGITATKKVGNAVTRNRAKRRLRALVHAEWDRFAEDGRDYVLIALKTTPSRQWDDLVNDFRKALGWAKKQAAKEAEVAKEIKESKKT